MARISCCAKFRKPPTALLCRSFEFRATRNFKPSTHLLKKGGPRTDGDRLLVSERLPPRFGFRVARNSQNHVPPCGVDRLNFVQHEISKRQNTCPKRDVPSRWGSAFSFQRVLRLGSDFVLPDGDRLSRFRAFSASVRISCCQMGIGFLVSERYPPRFGFRVARKFPKPGAAKTPKTACSPFVPVV